MIQSPPYKSIAGALFLCLMLGPVGLLYASFWGGLCMIIVGFVIINSKLLFPIILFWILCCLWGVRAAESYNRKVLAIYTEKFGS
jgi:hypothetical protein